MMKLKRKAALLLSAVLLLGAAMPFASASSAGAADEPTAAALSLERLGGAFGNLLGRLLKPVSPVKKMLSK